MTHASERETKQSPLVTRVSLKEVGDNTETKKERRSNSQIQQKMLLLFAYKKKDAML